MNNSLAKWDNVAQGSHREFGLPVFKSANILQIGDDVLRVDFLLCF